MDGGGGGVVAMEGVGDAGLDLNKPKKELPVDGADWGVSVPVPPNQVGHPPLTLFLLRRLVCFRIIYTICIEIFFSIVRY